MTVPPMSAPWNAAEIMPTPEGVERSEYFITDFFYKILEPFSGSRISNYETQVSLSKLLLADAESVSLFCCVRSARLGL